MKARLIELMARINALTLRERGLLFAAVAAVIVFIGHSAVLGPIYREQDLLREQISQQQNNLAGMDGEIAARVQAFQVDPDAPAREKLQAIRQETAALGDSLLAMEHGLVPPERMAPLVDTILRANARLKLVSMRTLPVESMSSLGAQAAATPAPPAAEGSDAAPGQAPAPALLYRHGVEVTVRGSYLDMVDYMSALEAMPTRLFWGRAQLDVEAYPAARLTLTLYTLSLDRKWMKL
ncbi:type II secretion system protein GspM [Massilia sp. LC238]|uniref:type II secretion system protein GspM n=1 Tax=Massilia sp. LC238 TaxID=1502852 RepID=UPI0004E43EC8|nr:type II secretion system protein GspM [Massilia sp. LC238]KFC65154.1 General secretion pathway, M protein [Massilia sp. LC238]